MAMIPWWLLIALAIFLAALGVVVFAVLAVGSQRILRLYYEAREERAQARAGAAVSERQATERTLAARKAQLQAEQEITRIEALKRAAARADKDIANGLGQELERVSQEHQALTRQHEALTSAHADLEAKHRMLDQAHRELMATDDDTSEALRRQLKENKALQQKLDAQTKAQQDIARLRVAADAGASRR